MHQINRGAGHAPEYDGIYQMPERQADFAAPREWLPPMFTGTRWR